LGEEKIVMAAIEFLQREKLLPDVKFLDYAEVAKVRIKRLKPVVRYIMLKLPGVTEALIRASLKRAGMQFPRSRARKLK
jgi:hypothetical protein